MTCLWHVDLGGREADARRRVHGLRHVGDELLERLIEHGDGGGHFVEPGVGVAEDVQKRPSGDKFACKLNRLYGQSNATYKTIRPLCYIGVEKPNFQPVQEAAKGTGRHGPASCVSLSQRSFSSRFWRPSALRAGAELRRSRSSPTLPTATSWCRATRSGASPALHRFSLALAGAVGHEPRADPNPHLIYPGIVHPARPGARQLTIGGTGAPRRAPHRAAPTRSASQRRARAPRARRRRAGRRKARAARRARSRSRAGRSPASRRRRSSRSFAARW